jgi:acetoacetyl-CoA synthetase
VTATPPILWRPSAERIERAQLTGFARRAGERHGLDLARYDDLWRWSVTDIDAFWRAVRDEYEIGAVPPETPVLGSRAMPGAEWFPGARANYAERLCRGRDPAGVALVHASELRPLAEVTWLELAARTARVAGGLRALGVGEGDRVAAYLPNVPEAVAGLLACASLGAVWTSCSPDFGVRSVVDRFAQIEPRVLLAVDGYRYGGRDFDRRDTVAAVEAALPSVEHTVVLGYLHPEPDLSALRAPRRWEELEELGAGAELSFADLPFDHPLWVL